MAKINRPFVGIFAVFILLMTCFVSWISLSEYVAFFRLSNVITFSWKVGMMIFAAPTLFYFCYLAFYAFVKNEQVKMNNKLANSFVAMAFLGAVFSIPFSFYLSHNLNNRGYMTCPKGSWMDPNKYVKDINLCR